MTTVTSKIKRDTSVATIITIVTRRNCMKATSLGSAPNDSAIAIIPVAAPGEQPQAAVVDAAWAVEVVRVVETGAHQGPERASALVSCRLHESTSPAAISF